MLNGETSVRSLKCEYLIFIFEIFPNGLMFLLGF